MDGGFFYSRHQEAFEGKLVVNYMQILHSAQRLDIPQDISFYHIATVASQFHVCVLSRNENYKMRPFFSVFHHSAILVFSIK